MRNFKYFFNRDRKVWAEIYVLNPILYFLLPNIILFTIVYYVDQDSILWLFISILISFFYNLTYGMYDSVFNPVHFYFVLKICTKSNIKNIVSKNEYFISLEKLNSISVILKDGVEIDPTCVKFKWSLNSLLNNIAYLKINRLIYGLPTMIMIYEKLLNEQIEIENYEMAKHTNETLDKLKKESLIW